MLIQNVFNLLAVFQNMSTFQTLTSTFTGSCRGTYRDSEPEVLVKMVSTFGDIPAPAMAQIALR